MAIVVLIARLGVVTNVWVLTKVDVLLWDPLVATQVVPVSAVLGLSYFEIAPGAVAGR